MLEAVWRSATVRKLRLFGVACCRRVWHLLADERSRRAVEVAEVYADDRSAARELKAARAGARAADKEAGIAASGARAAAETAGVHAIEDGAYRAAMAVRFAAAAQLVPKKGRTAAEQVAYEIVFSAGWPDPDGEAARARECDFQCDLYRCIFGNPFLPPFTVNPAVLAYNDGAAVKLATVIYNDRDPSTGLLDATGLAILADALEEAGVDDDAALEHLSGPGPHCRGCHVVDAVLGRS